MVRDTIPSKKNSHLRRKIIFFHRKFFSRIFLIFSKIGSQNLNENFNFFDFWKNHDFKNENFEKSDFVELFFSSYQFFFGVDNFFKVQLRCKNSSSFELWGFQDDSGTPSGRTDSFCTCEIRFRAYGQLLYSIEIYYRKSAKSIFAKNGMKNSKISNNHAVSIF